MARRVLIVLLALGVALLALQSREDRRDAPAASSTAPQSRPSAPGYPAFLPPEAIETLQQIARGGPFPYDRDGSVFQNREGRLPARPRGYYREYTVPTPGSADRGARRIVAGGEPPEVYYFTDDHYRSFRRLNPQGH